MASSNQPSRWGFFRIVCIVVSYLLLGNGNFCEESSGFPDLRFRVGAWGTNERFLLTAEAQPR